MPAQIRLRVDQFLKIGVTKGWTRQYDDARFSFAAAAAAINISESSLNRIYNGHLACSGAFIARLLIAAAPWDFNDLFVVDDLPVSDGQDDDAPPAAVTPPRPRIPAGVA